jgi:hypothetical protein
MELTGFEPEGVFVAPPPQPATATAMAVAASALTVSVMAANIHSRRVAAHAWAVQDIERARSHSYTSNRANWSHIATSQVGLVHILFGATY